MGFLSGFSKVGFVENYGQRLHPSERTNIFWYEDGSKFENGANCQFIIQKHIYFLDLAYDP